MERLARTVLARGRLVVAGWALLALAGAATASGTVDRLTDSYAMPGRPSYEADTRIVAEYGNGGAQEPIVPVVQVPPGTRVDDPAVAARLGRVFAAARVRPDVRVVDYRTAGDRAFLGRDGRTAFALVLTAPNRRDGISSLDRAVERAVTGAAPPGWRVHVTGMRELANAKPPARAAGVVVESLVGAAGALLVLAFVFASFLAVLPLVVAIVSILTSFLLLRGLTAVTDVSFIVEYLVALIGLGLAIDYSLLVVSRWREERSRGRSEREAVAIAVVRAGRAVVFSGVTVAAGLLALVVLPVPFLRSIGLGGLLIPLASVAVSVTLLPVLLLAFGRRLDWPHWRTDATASRAWSRWARLVTRRPVAAAALALVLLGLLIAPLASMHLGEAKTETLARSGTARTGLDMLEASGVPSGVLSPMEVLTRPGRGEAVASRLARVEGVEDAVVAASGPRSDLVDVLPEAEAGQDAGKDTIGRVRTSVERDRAVLGVGGVGATQLDAVDAIYGSFPLMLALVSLVTFVLLARAFRSLLLPAKAVLLNLVSLGAAYGLLVLVWQEGHGSGLLWGVDATGAVTFWVPVFVFAFLFGLSMDYEVFVLARVREAYERTGSTREALVEGVGRTGRLVTSATLILVFAFLAMSTGPETDLEMLATGLGAGILVDAFVVRTLLLPALVSLLGGWNWALPAFAERALGVGREDRPETVATD